MCVVLFINGCVCMSVGGWVGMPQCQEAKTDHSYGFNG